MSVMEALSAAKQVRVAKLNPCFTNAHTKAK
jgi:hypothetical protein